MNRKHLSILPFTLLLLCACSSSVSVTTTRFSGVVLDRSMIVEVGRISGNESDEFRQELAHALASMRFGGERALPGTLTTLTVEGIYVPTMDRSSTTETVDGKEVERIEEVYSVQFDYRIIHAETGREVTHGSLTETSSDTEEREDRGLLANILHAIVSAVISGDPYSDLREDIIARFIGEISPHDRVVEVTLFEDSDMPELEQGIRQARIGRWKEALGIFLDAIERHAGNANLHKAYYNAGVGYEYTHQYSLAKEYMERALDLAPEPEYAAELRRCIRYEQEWKWREEYLESLRMVGK